jgi:sulfur carrier protein
LNLIRVIPAEGSESSGQCPALQAAFAAFFISRFAATDTGGPEDGEDNVEIQVNGERRAVGSCTVLGLLEQLDIDPRRVAIELNLEILPKSDYGTTLLCDGDRVEIVQFVGGG